MFSLGTSIAPSLRPFVAATLLLTALQLSAKTKASQPRTVLLADAGWKFFLGDPADAESSKFNDESWRTITLPHDWSIEGAPSEKNTTGSGGGYYPAGIGWYRKTFSPQGSWRGKQICLELDGVAGDTSVYLNGKKLGVHPYAYTSFRFDITPYLDLSAKNVLALRVDNSMQPSSRWYSGSGIYRHVRLVITESIHVAPWGVFVSTPEASDKSARVLIKTQLENTSTNPEGVTLNTILETPSGIKLREVSTTVQIQPGQSAEAAQEITLDRPSLWSPASPSLYHAITRAVTNGKLRDEVQTPFGIRSLAWSAEKGLLLGMAQPSNSREAAFITTMGRSEPPRSTVPRKGRFSCLKRRESTLSERHITRLHRHSLMHATVSACWF